jgi:hypothetical protein
VPIAVGKRAVTPPFGIGIVARTLGALIDNRPTPCFVVTIEIAGLRIERKGEGQFSLGEIAPGFEVVAPMSAPESLIRELAPIPAARAALDRLQPADDSPYRRAPFPDRLHRLDHALRSGSLETCADLLTITMAGLLASAPGGLTLSFGERKAVHALERVVIGEIALALDEPADRLLEQVRARFTPNA